MVNLKERRVKGKPSIHINTRSPSDGLIHIKYTNALQRICDLTQVSFGTETSDWDSTLLPNVIPIIGKNVYHARDLTRDRCMQGRESAADYNTKMYFEVGY